MELKEIQKVHNTPERVKKYYEELTDDYIASFGNYFQALQSKKPENIVRNMVKVLPFAKGMKILDAGCGICGPAITLAGMKKVMIEALTLSEKQVEYAEANIQKARRLKGSIHVSSGDFHLLENLYPKDCFDVAYYLESLCHSHDPEKAMRSLRNVLKPGGYVYIKDLFKGPENPDQPNLVDFPVSAINEACCLKVQELGAVISALTRNGFMIEACRMPNFAQDFTKGHAFTVKQMLKLHQNQEGAYIDQNINFLHWLEIIARRQY